MSYGLKLTNADGSVAMSTENFGLQIVDDFVVAPGASGSRTYPELDYFTNLYATTGSEYGNVTQSRALTSHAFMDLGGSVDPSTNIPTITWSSIFNQGAPGIGAADYCNLCQTGGNPHTWQPPAYGARPSTRIIVMVA